MASFANLYHHRKVADTASKACEVCYKPSTSVLITPDNKDYFFVCPVHLKEKSFAIPMIDKDAIAAREKKEKDAELEKVKQELIDEKQRKQKEKEKEKKEEDKDEKKGEDKKKEEVKSPLPDEEPRIFTLHKTFYQQRLDKKRNAQRARREREHLQTPNLFPQVPKGPP